MWSLGIMTGERELYLLMRLEPSQSCSGGASLTHLWDTGINMPTLHQLNGKLASAVMCVLCSTLITTAVPDF